MLVFHSFRRMIFQEWMRITKAPTFRHDRTLIWDLSDNILLDYDVFLVTVLYLYNPKDCDWFALYIVFVAFVNHFSLLKVCVIIHRIVCFSLTATHAFGPTVCWESGNNQSWSVFTWRTKCRNCDDARMTHLQITR